MKTAPAVSVPASAGGFDLYQCISTDIAFDGKLPESIQFYPPGRTHINAQVGGEIDVNINEAVSEVIKADFEAMLADFKANLGPKPFIDFNHNKDAAAGWVTDIFWAGEDPKLGGIRGNIEWTRPGSDAITGKSYRYFSPNFRVSRDTGEIVGTTAIMGGLVNTPAFRNIASVIAKEAGATTVKKTKEQKTMPELIKALMAAGLLSADPTDDAAAVADFKKNWDAMGKSEMEAAKCATDKIMARMAEKDLEVVSAKQSVTEIQAKLAGLQLKHAEAMVQAAVADGLIAPKDEPSKARWVKAITADVEAVELLRSFNVMAKATANMPVLDITAPIITQKPEVNIVPGGDKWDARVSAVMAKENCTHGKAVQIAAKAFPKEYDEHSKQRLITSK